MDRVATGQGKVREIQGQGKVREFSKKSEKFRILEKVREISHWSGKFRGFGRYSIHANDTKLIDGARI